MNDRELTQFQEFGYVSFYKKTLAEVVDGVQTLGIDPRVVEVIGSITVAGIEIPRRRLDRSENPDSGEQK